MFVATRSQLPAPSHGLMILEPQLRTPMAAPLSRPSVRLSEALEAGEPQGFRSFAALPGNLKAIESALEFAQGRVPLVAVVGPSGWGKTHLLRATTDMLGSQGACVVPRSALEWIMDPSRSDANHPLVLDDTQDVLRHPRARHQFRQALLRRVRSRRPTMLSFAGARVGRSLKAFVPFSREWNWALIAEPTCDERELVVRQIATTERMLLSQATTRLIARHLHGNGRSVSGALKRLKMYRSDWSDRDAVCQACGVLMPYLLGRDGWDPRDHVFEAVSQTVAGVDGAPSGTVQDITAYLLWSEIGLSEDEIATFLRVTPSSVYTRSVDVRKRMEDSAYGALVGSCRRSVIDAFEQA